jgi:2-haloacid dehalogenase
VRGRAIGATHSPIRAIAFDAFPIFNPARLAETATSFFGDAGKTLAAAWSMRLFSLTWLVTAADRYQPFETLAGLALDSAARDAGIDLSSAMRRDLVDAFGDLKVWPDVPEALERLRSRGLRLRFLSNLGEVALERNMRTNRIRDYFDPPLSTDQVRRFKPSPAAYAMATRAFGLPREEIGFAAFANWDAAGAAHFGFPTAWVNRSAAAPDSFGPEPARSGKTIEALLDLVGGSGADS